MPRWQTNQHGKHVNDVVKQDTVTRSTGATQTIATSFRATFTNLCIFHTTFHTTTRISQTTTTFRSYRWAVAAVTVAATATVAATVAATAAAAAVTVVTPVAVTVTVTVVVVVVVGIDSSC